MGRRGRKRRLDVEDEYWALILAGVGTVEACQRVLTLIAGYSRFLMALMFAQWIVAWHASTSEAIDLVMAPLRIADYTLVCDEPTTAACTRP